MLDIETTIGKVEQLYKEVAGHDVPPLSEAPYAAIPPEKDPQAYVEEQIARLNEALNRVSQLRQEMTVTPPLCLIETADSYCMCVDLCGAQKDSVRVTQEGDALMVQAQRTLASDEPDQRVLWQEAPVLARYVRRIAMPRDARAELLDASFADGVLTLRVPKEAAAQAARTFDVK